MLSIRSLLVAMAGILALFNSLVYPFSGVSAQVTVNVDYNDVTVSEVDRRIFGLCTTQGAPEGPIIPLPGSEGYDIYVDLAQQCGVSYLHVPGAAYWHRYNWLTGIGGVYDDYHVQGYSIADWKQLCEDMNCGLIGVISPRLYWSLDGGVDPESVAQWCVDNWSDEPEKWQYWSIGCECYGDWDYEYFADVDSFCMAVNEIASAMKSVAPDIKIGVPFEIIWMPGPEWCQTVLEKCGDNIDFVNFHWYPHDHWTDPYGAMQHYPWLEEVLLPRLRAHFDQYLDGRQLEILIGEYDFWGMDGYPPNYVRRNTTLANALAWGDFLGQAIRLGIEMGAGYDFVGTSSYAFLLWWYELQSFPVKYSPKTWILGAWSKYFGQSMVNATVEGSPSYITQDGRGEWANVDVGYLGYEAVPVDYVTVYAGMDSIDERASLILINKHNDASYALSINLSGVNLGAAAQTDVYTLTTDHPEGLMAANRQWDSDDMESLPPTHTTMVVGDSFDFTLGPHSMVTMRFPLAATPDAVAPMPVADLTASDPTTNSITLSWTAPGDDGNNGTASQYDIRHSTALITEANWSSAAQVSGEPAPQSAGTSQSMNVAGLDPSTLYYFAIRSADEVPNWSGLSNVASGTTPEPDNQPPRIGSIQCEKEASWVDCSEVGYGDTVTGLRANITDSDGTVSSVKFRLENLPDNHDLLDMPGSSAGGGWHLSDSCDLLIEDSGDLRLTVTATDDDAASGSVDSTWFVPWGTLSASLIDPAQDFSVYQNQSFTFQAQLACLGGECGDIEAILDPTLRLDQTTGLEDTYININYDQNANSDALCTCTWPQGMVANAVLMKWDISSLEATTIEDAQLYLYLYHARGDDPYTLTVHKIMNHDPVISAADGYTYDGMNDIPLAQADIGPAVDVVDIDMIPGYKSFDVTPLIQDWQANPETDYGLLINSDALAAYDSYRYFCSQEHAVADQRPYMMVTHSQGSFKGAVATTVGATPFYTTSSNPQTRANMKAGDAFDQTWEVVPTGGIDGSYEFFVINHPTTYSAYLSDVETPRVNITIVQSPVNDPPYFDPPTADQSIDEEENLSFSIHVTDPDGDSITLGASNLPGNSTFTVNGAGSGTFDWTPDHSDAGEYLVTFHASDGVNPSVDGQATIIVNDVDTTPPVISNVSAAEITRHEATISWNTDEVATSLVEYGLTPSYGSTTNLDTNLVANHSQRLTGLYLDTLYHFRVRSRDVAGNEAMSQDYVFRTAPRPGSPSPTNPPDDTTLEVSNPDLVILNAIDSMGFQLLHLFEIDTTIQFNSLNLQQSTPFALDYVDDSTSLWTVPQELTTGTYYWRAYAYTNTLPSDTSDPSEVFSFRVGSSDVTDTVYQLTLEYPLPNETVPTLRPILVARLVSGSSEMNLLSCEFEVSEDSYFSSNVLSPERTTFSADRTANWEVNPDLKQNTRFYWRAKLWSGDRVLDVTRTQIIFTGAIHAFPNPFKPSLGHSQVTFRYVPLNSTVTVTTIAGDVVKTFDYTKETDIVWDVKGEGQNELASGVYLYWVSHTGKVSSGKLLVIR